MSIASNNSCHSGRRASDVPNIPIFLSFINNSSPIQNLPRELLEEIFLYHTPPDGRGASYLRNDCWTLISVCQSWRYVATHCPRLWQHITVPVQALAARCSDPVAFLSLIISRAKALDLFITFDASPAQYDGVNNLCEVAVALLNVLTARSTQWRTIQLIKLDITCLRALDGVHGKLPRLIDLDIHYRPDAQWGTTGFTVAPLLERISLVFAEVIVLGGLAGQAQLTEYSVVGAYYDSSLVDLLRQCRVVKRVAMYFLRPSIPPGQRVTSQITALTFNGFPSDLTLVHLPQLRVLSLGDVADVSLRTILPSLLDLVKHSLCPLVSLKLMNCDLAGLVEILEVVPYLQNLTIVFEQSLPKSTAFVSGVDQALLALMNGLAKVDLVPNLQKLLLHFAIQKKGFSSKLTFFKHQEVTRMLQRRSQLQASGRFLFEERHIAEEGWVGGSVNGYST
ncbi:hypothetical protein CPB85DRAFT_1257694 [Mucidula mucida]|nr:hypothetical protein CPB85DRAFT_1257694 [Mucidula mucida]